VGRKKNAKTLLDAFEKALKSGQFSKSGDEYVIHCPFCDDSTGHHYINLYKKMSYCFNSSCHASVIFTTFFAGHNVRNILATEISNRKHRDKGQEAIDLSCPLKPIFGHEASPLVSMPVQATIRKVYNYCLSRGMTHKQIEEYKVSFKPYEGRAYFPYWNGDGQTVFWMGRALGDQLPKTAEKRGSEKPLFGRHVKRIRNGPVVLVEGVFDHFATPNSYALMGSSITASQIAALIEDHIPRVFFIADPDASEAMQSMASALSGSHIEAYPVQLIGTTADPAELGREAMSKVVGELLKMDLALPQVLRVSVDSLPF